MTRAHPRSWAGHPEFRACYRRHDDRLYVVLRPRAKKTCTYTYTASLREGSTSKCLLVDAGKCSFLGHDRRTVRERGGRATPKTTATEPHHQTHTRGKFVFNCPYKRDSTQRANSSATITRELGRVGGSQKLPSARSAVAGLWEWCRCNRHYETAAHFLPSDSGVWARGRPSPGI
jgi:hypothetical protein